MTDIDRIVAGMARALFCTDWAEWREVAGFAHSNSALAPPTTRDYENLAWRLVGKYEQANNCHWSVLLSRAVRADNAFVDCEAFGSDLAMMAMGSGVSWFDDHENFDLVVPEIALPGAPADARDAFYTGYIVRPYKLMRGADCEWEGNLLRGRDVGRLCNVLGIKPEGCKLVEEVLGND